MNITIDKIKRDQVWAFKKATRGDIVISHVNVHGGIVYWFYKEHDSIVMDSPFDRFVLDFFPRDETPFKDPEKLGPNDDRDFLI